MSRTRSVASLAVLTVVALGSGCVMPDQFSKLQKDMADVRQQLAGLQAEQARNQAAQDELRRLARGAQNDGSAVTPENIADLTFRIDQAARDTAETNQRLAEFSQRFERVTQQLQRRANDSTSPLPPGMPDMAGAQAGTPPVIGADRGATASGQSAEELYNTAYADFSKGNYELAIAGFNEFHQLYPTDPKADNALYWVGECNFSQGEFSRAIQAFDRLLELFPTSEKAASGDLKKGLAYLEQNEVGRAIVQLQHVHDTYGGTDESRVARDRLTALGVSI